MIGELHIRISHLPEIRSIYWIHV